MAKEQAHEAIDLMAALRASLGLEEDDRARAQQQAQLPPPPEQDGWYPDTEMDVYLGWPLVSGSVLGAMHGRTPWHAYAAMHERDEDRTSVALRLGSVVHTALLEPDRLEVDYVLLPVPDPERYTTAAGKPSANPAGTKAYKDHVAAVLAANPGKQPVEPGAMAKAVRLRDAVYGHRRARQLLEAKGPVEVTGVATDPVTGVRVKIRPDKLVPALGVDVNPKTTRSAAYNSFSADVYRFGYARSAALRKLAMGWLGWEWRSTVLVAIETDGPLTAECVAVYELDEGAMDAGEQVVQAMLQRLARCYETGEWPGYDMEVQPLSLPPWAWARIDEELDLYA